MSTNAMLFDIPPPVAKRNTFTTQHVRTCPRHVPNAPRCTLADEACVRQSINAAATLRAELHAAYMQHHEDIVAASWSELDKRIAMKQLLIEAANMDIRSIAKASTEGSYDPMVDFCLAQWKAMITGCDMHFANHDSYYRAHHEQGIPVNPSASQQALEIISSLGIWFTGPRVAIPLRPAISHGSRMSGSACAAPPFRYSHYIMHHRQEAQKQLLSELEWHSFNNRHNNLSSTIDSSSSSLDNDRLLFLPHPALVEKVEAEKNAAAIAAAVLPTTTAEEAEPVSEDSSVMSSLECLGRTDDDEEEDVVIHPTEQTTSDGELESAACSVCSRIEIPSSADHTDDEEEEAHINPQTASTEDVEVMIVDSGEEESTAHPPSRVSITAAIPIDGFLLESDDDVASSDDLVEQLHQQLTEDIELPMPLLQHQPTLCPITSTNTTESLSTHEDATSSTDETPLEVMLVLPAANQQLQQQRRASSNNNDEADQQDDEDSYSSFGGDHHSRPLTAESETNASIFTDNSSGAVGSTLDFILGNISIGDDEDGEECFELELDDDGSLSTIVEDAATRMFNSDIEYCTGIDSDGHMFVSLAFSDRNKDGKRVAHTNIVIYDEEQQGGVPLATAQ